MSLRYGRGHLLLCALVAAGAASPGWAACTVSAVGPEFGNYSTRSTVPLQTAGTVVLDCSSAPLTAPAKISFSTGNSNNYATRHLQSESGSHRLRYNIYHPKLFLNGSMAILGDGTGETATVSTSAPRTSVHFIAQILPGQNVPPGRYNDTITVIVDY